MKARVPMARMITRGRVDRHTELLRVVVRVKRSQPNPERLLELPPVWSEKSLSDILTFSDLAFNKIGLNAVWL